MNDHAFLKHASNAIFRLSKLNVLLAAAALVMLPAGPVAASGAPPPQLMLAKVYRPDVLLADYWVSEKYDGIRGYWDGEKLRTRGGETIIAPAWFTAGWPTTPMDGELWAGHGRFAKALSTVRQQRLDEASNRDWRGIRFMVFDVPAEVGTFTERIPKIAQAVGAVDQAWVKAVVQTRASTHAALQLQLAKIVKSGGEGLMLHQGSSLYRGVRSDDLLKVKTHDDAEARVVGHVAGKGKYAGQLGALLMEMPAEGSRPPLRFKLGTGLTDEQRRSPPALGSLVTYRFRGLNDSGIPRFASFMRLAAQ